MSPVLASGSLSLFAAEPVFVVAIVVFLLVAAVVLIVEGLGLRYIPNNRVGIVEKLWSLQRLGARRPHHRPQRRGRLPGRGAPRRLPLRLWRWQYRIHKVPLVTMPQGKIGYVYARDGEPLPPSQTLGRVVDCNNFQDARAFLGDGSATRPRRPARPPAGDPARRRLRDQPRPVRRHHRRRSSTASSLQGQQELETLVSWQNELARDRRLQPGRHRRRRSRPPTRSIPTRRCWSTASASSRCTTARRCRPARSSPRRSAPTATTRTTTTTSRTPRRSCGPAAGAAGSTCR